MAQKPVNGSQQPTIRRGHPMPIYARLMAAFQAMRENTPKALSGQRGDSCIGFQKTSIISHKGSSIGSRLPKPQTGKA